MTEGKFPFLGIYSCKYLSYWAATAWTELNAR